MSIRFIVQIFNSSGIFDTWILRFLYAYFTDFRYTQSLLSVVVADDIIPKSKKKERLDGSSYMPLLWRRHQFQF